MYIASYISKAEKGMSELQQKSYAEGREDKEAVYIILQ